MKTIFALAGVFALGLSRGAYSCASVGADGMPIRTTDESALIVWNSKSGIEHFVRRASFETRGKDFGFLVPTPSRPELGEASDELFDALESEVERKTKIETRRGFYFGPMFFFPQADRPIIRRMYGTSSSSMTTTEGVRSVEVVEQKRVGDYNASVLRASDVRTLTKWLRDHHYAVSSDTREWLAPYVQKGYFLTAFQIASEGQRPSAQAKAVRLSFKTEAPFYPYREPRRAQKVSGGRTLRVFFVGDKRVEGKIENGARTEGWPGDLEYSAAVDAAKLQEHGLDISGKKLRLTAFRDSSSPRPGWGDLWFSPSRRQGEVTPPPHIDRRDYRVWIPCDVLAIFSLVILLYGLRRQKRANLRLNV